MYPMVCNSPIHINCYIALHLHYIPVHAFDQYLNALLYYKGIEAFKMVLEYIFIQQIGLINCMSDTLYNVCFSYSYQLLYCIVHPTGHSV